MAAEDNDIRETSTGADDTVRGRSLDDLAKGLASGRLPRREVLKWIGSTLLWGALVSIPGISLAQNRVELEGAGSELAPNLDVNSKQMGPGSNQTAAAMQSANTGNLQNAQGGVQANSPEQQNPPGQQNPPAQQNPLGQQDGGGGPACQSASDCPPPSNACQQATCTNGVCGVENKPDGTGCDDGNPCTTNDVCTNGTCAGTLIEGCVTCQNDQDCSSFTGPCATATCVAGACAQAFKEAGTVCRPAAGPCDVEETCTGTSAQCPPDQFQQAGIVCREAVEDCEEDAICSGNSPNCPDNPFSPNTKVCRPAAGPCDVEETCTGTSAQCPPDQFRPAGTVCRPAGSNAVCDPAETCTGASAQCPPNQFAPNGTTGCGNPATRQCCNGVCCAANTPVCCGGTCRRAQDCPA